MNSTVLNSISAWLSGCELVLVRHAQLSLDQSDSKILETPINREKSKLLNNFFGFAYKSRGVTKQFFQGYVRACSKGIKIILQRLQV